MLSTIKGVAVVVGVSLCLCALSFLSVPEGVERFSFPPFSLFIYKLTLLGLLATFSQFYKVQDILNSSFITDFAYFKYFFI